MIKITDLKGNYLIIATILFLLTSCATPRLLRIELPEQGKNELPEHIQSLAIVSRIPYPIFTDTKSDTLQKIFYDHRFNLDTTLFEISAADTLLKALGELLFESGRYDFVIPENRFMMKNKSYLAPEMPWNEVVQICKTYKTDAVLSLEHLRQRVITSYATRQRFSDGSWSYLYGSVAIMKVINEAYVRVYDPRQKTVVYRELIKDTLIWEDADESTSELFSRFTPVKAALNESCIEIALTLADKLGTNWRQSERHYFDKGSKDLKTAGEYIGADDWIKAVQIWKEIAENQKTKTLKSKAEYNLALASELDGDLDSAITWALKSYKTQYRTVTYDYLEILKKRKNESKK